LTDGVESEEVKTLAAHAAVGTRAATETRTAATITFTISRQCAIACDHLLPPFLNATNHEKGFLDLSGTAGTRASAMDIATGHISH